MRCLALALVLALAAAPSALLAAPAQGQAMSRPTLKVPAGKRGTDTPPKAPAKRGIAKVDLAPKPGVQTMSRPSLKLPASKRGTAK